MKHRIITICGSMRNYNQMLAAANILTLDGWLVFMPFVLKVDDPDVDEWLQEIHRAKIDASDAILVIGKPGESTEQEIRYARQTGKEVRFDDVAFIAEIVMERGAQ